MPNFMLHRLRDRLAALAAGAALLAFAVAPVAANFQQGSDGSDFNAADVIATRHDVIQVDQSGPDEQGQVETDQSGPDEQGQVETDQSGPDQAGD